LAGRAAFLYLPQGMTQSGVDRHSGARAAQGEKTDPLPKADETPKSDEQAAKETRPETVRPAHLQRELLEELGYDYHRTRLEFSKDPATGDLVIRVFNRDTDELLREIPPEELRNVSKFLQQLQPKEPAKGRLIEIVT
jgi:flagellar protein FlaG